MMQSNIRPTARAVIKGSEEFPDIRGEVLFYQRRSAVIVHANIRDLPKNLSGFYGFHIHEGDSCRGGAFPRTGGHYQPGERVHPAHAGDLPPLLYCSGSAYLEVKTDRFTVGEIIGRTVVIHGGADDFRTQPSGNAGNKIACGEIHRV